MSFGLGDARKRPGIFDSFRAAMTPPAAAGGRWPTHQAPRPVKAATVLAMLAGLVFVVIGGFSLLTTDDQLNTAVASYNSAISDCTTQFGGIGDAVVVPAGASEDVTATANACKQYRPLTDETDLRGEDPEHHHQHRDPDHRADRAAGGWFLRTGARWSRLAVVGAVVISVILTMAFQVSNLLTLVCHPLDDHRGDALLRR